jgi:hypothetical protein
LQKANFFTTYQLFFRVPFSLLKGPKTAKTIDMKGFQMFIKVTQYAEHRNCSARRIRKMIQTGKITRNSWKHGKRGYLIHQEKADKDLAENLDKIHNPDHARNKKPEPMPKTWFYEGECRKTAERIHVQEQAADAASEGEEPGPGGYMVPLPIWDIHYIAALFHLDPDRVEIERIDKLNWRLKVHDLDNETGDPCPWSVDLVFDFNLDQGD